MRKRGISEKLVYIYNPLPAVSEKDLIDQTDLEMLEASEKNFFQFRWKYGAADEYEFVIVEPKEMLALRQSEAPEFMREFAELGAVVLEDPSDELEVARIALNGLRKAQKYWADRGTKRVMEYRKTHGIGRDELEDHKYDLWVYFRNQAAADAVEAEMKAVRSAAAKGE